MAFADEMRAALRAGENPRNLMEKFVEKLIELEALVGAGDDVENRLDALESDMTTAQSDIDTLQTHDADHESRIAVLEA